MSAATRAGAHSDPSEPSTETTRARGRWKHVGRVAHPAVAAGTGSSLVAPTAAPLGVPLLGVGVGPVVGLFIVSAVPICARRNSGLTSAPCRAQTNR